MSPVIILWIIGIIVNISGITNFFPTGSILDFIFNERNLEFLFGCLSAYFISKYNFKYGVFLVSIGAFLFSLSAIAYFAHQQVTLSPVFTFAVPFTLVISGSVYIEKNHFVKIPSIFIVIGNASYAIYLLHGFLINNFTKVLMTLFNKLNLNTLYQNHIISNLLAIIIASLTISIGIAIYLYVEKPTLKLLRRKILVA